MQIARLRNRLLNCVVVLWFFALVMGSMPHSWADDGTDGTGQLGKWISKINDAAQTTSYDGLFLYRHGNELETMRVVHLNDNGKVTERIFSLNGAPREVVRDQNQVWCYLPDQQMGVHDYRQTNDKNFPRLLSGNSEVLASHYQLKTLAKDRVADRMTDVVAIMPKDALRYGYKLWIDETTGLLLRADLVDQAARKVLEQYMFVSLRTGNDIQANDLKPRTPKRELKWFGPTESDSQLAGLNKAANQGKSDKDTDGDNDDNANRSWVCDDLPTGFDLTDSSVQVSSVTSTRINHLVFSDGLATVSVFVEKETEGKRQQSHVNRLEGAQMMGAMSAFGRQVDGHHITVVGEVPVETVRRIAKSMRLK